MRDVFYALCKVNYYEAQEPVAIPEDGEEVTDEMKERFAEQNEEIEKTNELFAKLKNYVKLVGPPVPAEGEDPASVQLNPNTDLEAQEKCLVRIQNYRDPLNQEDQAAAMEAQAKQSTMSKAEHASGMSVNDAKSQANGDAVSDTES